MSKELTPEEDFLENVDIPNETLEDLEGQHFYSQSQVLWLLKEFAAKAVEAYKDNLKDYAYNVEDQAGNNLTVIDIEDLDESLNQNPNK